MRCARNVARLLVAVTFCLVLCPVQNLLANKKPPVHPVNLNAPVPPNCRRVSGIGPSTADKILQLRKSYGGYKSVDDLLAIKGIGQERLDNMHKYRTVGKIPPTKPASTKPVTPPRPPPTKTTEREEPYCQP
jgi:competence protein ComEA